MLGNAAVLTKAKAQRVFFRPFAPHVKLVGVLEDVFVSVRRLVRRNDALLGLDKLLDIR